MGEPLTTTNVGGRGGRDIESRSHLRHYPLWQLFHNASCHFYELAVLDLRSPQAHVFRRRRGRLNVFYEFLWEGGGEGGGRPVLKIYSTSVFRSRAMSVYSQLKTNVNTHQRPDPKRAFTATKGPI